MGGQIAADGDEKRNKLETEGAQKGSIKEQENALKMAAKTETMEKNAKQQQAGLKNELLEIAQKINSASDEGKADLAKAYEIKFKAHETSEKAGAELKVKAVNATKILDEKKLKAEKH